VKAQDFHVLVVGGGLAGLTAVNLLLRHLGNRRPDLRIGILEQRPPEPLPPDADTGLRVLAIAPAVRALLEQCGAWQALPARRAHPYVHMCVWQAGGSPAGGRRIVFDVADQGLPALGHIVEHDWLRLALWQGLDAGVSSGQVLFLSGEPPLRIDQEPDTATLVLADGARLGARLIIGADGADSFVRRTLGLTGTGHGYGQRALVAHVAGERSHADTAWQCFQPGGPVALLPLTDGRCSIVWSLPDLAARELEQADADTFGARLTEATAGVLGRLQLTTGRLGFPLAAHHAHRYTAPRCALIGDAAHQIHPLAGQGINLGLLDAAELARTLAEHLKTTRLADPGDVRALRRYERARKGANLLGLATMEGLHHLFTSTWPGVADAAGLGLGLVDRLGPLKRMLARQALGPAPAASARDTHADL